jgi:hypothetical protein
MFFLFPAPKEPNALKVFKRTADNQWASSETRMVSNWLYARSPASTLDELLLDIRKVAYHGGVMIHGSVKDGVESPIRRVSCGDKATIYDNPLPWVAMDVDESSIAPPGCTTADQSREWWMTASHEDIDAWYHDSLYPSLNLPDIFRGARCILHLSSSSFVDIVSSKKPSHTFRGHLIFQLSAGISVRYWKHALKDANTIDLSKYSPEHILYLSNPGWQTSTGHEAVSPWSHAGPHYAWRITRTGKAVVTMPDDAIVWTPPAVTNISYTPCVQLPQWRNDRWWNLSAIESQSKSTATGNRHETMRKQAVRIAKAITSRECDESIWGRFTEVWLAKDKSPVEIANLVRWACDL